MVKGSFIQGEQPISWTEDLGPMLLDLDYAQDGSGTGTPRFCNARIENGILRVPRLVTSKEV